MSVLQEIIIFTMLQCSANMSIGIGQMGEAKDSREDMWLNSVPTKVGEGGVALISASQKRNYLIRLTTKLSDNGSLSPSS